MLSVIIPTYNRAHLVVRAVESVLAQEGGGFEIVVVDDGSTDATEAALQAYAGRIRYLKKENGGVSSARNRGIAESTGEFVAFLDSDDLLQKTFASEMVAELASHPECGAVVCDGHLVDPGGRQLAEIHLATRIDPSDMLGSAVQTLPGWTPYMVVRRSALDVTGGFDEAFKTAEDIDLTLRVLTRFPMRHLPRALVQKTQTPGSLSGLVYTGNRLKVLDKFERDEPAVAARYRGQIRAARGRVHRSYGEDLLWNGRLQESRAELSRSLSFVRDPGVMVLVLKSYVKQVLGRGRGDA